MIDFESIAKRVSSDARLRREFLQDPVRVTEELLRQSYIELAVGFSQRHAELDGTPSMRLPRGGAADALTCASR